MKRCLAILAASVLAACSSSSSPGTVNSPALTTFSYSTPQAPTTTQQSTGSTASTDVGQVVVSASSGDAASASNAPELADSLGEQTLGTAAMAAPRSPAMEAAKQLVLKQRSGELSTSCYTQTGTTLTYNNCSYSGSGFTYTANGTLTATATNVTWNLTFTVSYSSSSETFNWDGVWTGDINYTSTSSGGTISGTALSQNSGNYSASGQSGNFAWTVGIDFLNMTWATSCDSGGGITGGTLEIRANETGNLNIYGYTQKGIEFDWSACDTFTVATST